VKRFVLDASAGVELLLNTTRARSLSAQLPLSAQWWVPEHYFVEVAGALGRAAFDQPISVRSHLVEIWIPAIGAIHVEARGPSALCQARSALHHDS
jgi:predicted nucleic acid-binding protein